MEKTIYIFPGLANGPENFDKIHTENKKVIIVYPEFNLGEDQELYI